jgi:hypothetical protein
LRIVLLRQGFRGAFHRIHNGDQAAARMTCDITRVNLTDATRADHCDA